MTKVGEHITLDFIGVKKDYSQKFYEKIIYKIAKSAKVEILGINSHKFEPQGFTTVALLAESHMSFHTFPEKGIVSFDFYMWKGTSKNSFGYSKEGNKIKKNSY